MTEVETTIQKNFWTQQNHLCRILKIYLTYGVLRPTKFLYLKITETDCEGYHINILTKQVVINNHKNDRKGKKVIDIFDELEGFLRKELGKYIITNQKKYLYQSSSAFTKKCLKLF